MMRVAPLASAPRINLFRGRRQLCQQVRPVASHDPAYLVVNHANHLEFLDLPSDHFKVFRAQRATL
jgi:hypothetical protein